MKKQAEKEMTNLDFEKLKAIFCRIMDYAKIGVKRQKAREKYEKGRRKQLKSEKKFSKKNKLSQRPRVRS